MAARRWTGVVAPVLAMAGVYPACWMRWVSMAQERPAEGHPPLGMAILTTYPQKAVLQDTALEEVLELALHVFRQRPDLAGQQMEKARIVCRNKIVAAAPIPCGSHSPRKRSIIGLSKRTIRAADHWPPQKPGACVRCRKAALYLRVCGSHSLRGSLKKSPP